MAKDYIETIKGKLQECPDIQGRNEFFNSCILALWIKIDRQYHFVFQKRSKDIRQGGEICFPGGEFDLKRDTSLLHTALRETKEEMGILPEQIQVIGRLDTLVNPMGVIVDAFLGFTKIESLEQMNYCTKEVEEIFAVPVDYFLEKKPECYQVEMKVHPFVEDPVSGGRQILFPAQQLGLPERYAQPWGNKRFNVYVYKLERGVLWGITARFVYDIVRKLKNV